MSERLEPRSQGEALRAERLRQLRARPPREIERIVQKMRRATTVPRLHYHVHKHGGVMAARDVDEYLQMLSAHLRRDDLRLFTYLRAKDRAAFWELVAPNTGITLLYNEARRSVWSFFEPVDADARMRRFETEWLEVLRIPDGWRFQEDWQWRE